MPTGQDPPPHGRLDPWTRAHLRRDYLRARAGRKLDHAVDAIAGVLGFTVAVLAWAFFTHNDAIPAGICGLMAFSAVFVAGLRIAFVRAQLKHRLDQNPLPEREDYDHGPPPGA